LSQRLKRTEAYSLKKIAASNPTGTAKAIATTVVSSVPQMSTTIPNSGSAKAGDHWVAVRNSTMETSLKNLMVSKMRTKTMPKVVNTER
jgi:hypothetical protein